MKEGRKGVREGRKGVREGRKGVREGRKEGGREEGLRKFKKERRGTFY